jgi:hypothetical protein
VRTGRRSPHQTQAHAGRVEVSATCSGSGAQQAMAWMLSSASAGVGVGWRWPLGREVERLLGEKIKTNKKEGQVSRPEKTTQ